MTLLEYDDKVMQYLEYLGYPYYVQFFRVEDVAKCAAHTINIMYRYKESYRMCALVIFGATWTYQLTRTDGVTLQ